jgi:hypothetical protein
MQWNRSNAIGLAKAQCTLCQGQGIRIVRGATEVPCKCVFRAIFRACYTRFHECVALGDHTGGVSLETCRGAEGRRTYSRKREEFLCDFALVSRRALNEPEYRIFRYHYLLGADWRLCCRQLKLNRGDFFHSVYEIEQKLGRVYAELKPYPLYPLDEYFGGKVRRRAPTPAVTLNSVFSGFDRRAAALQRIA